MHLHHVEISLQHKQQMLWICKALLVQECIIFLLQLFAIKALILNSLNHANAAGVADVALDILIHLTSVKCYLHSSLVKALFLPYHMLYDIIPEEEALKFNFIPYKNTRLILGMIRSA